MTSETKPLFIVRDYKQADHSFIMSTWLKGLRFGNDLFREIKSDVYFKEYNKIVDGLLAHPSVKVNVACLADDEDVILGYAVVSTDGTKAHFAFVKNSWRGIKIAKALVPNTVKIVTHLTKTGLSLARKYNMDYDPFNLP